MAKITIFLVAILLIVYIAITSYAPFKSKLFGDLYPKSQSFAATVSTYPQSLPAFSGNDLNKPTGLFLTSPQGFLWVTNSGNNSISVFNPDGTTGKAIITGNGLDSPWGITQVGSNIWVANSGSSKSISLFNYITAAPSGVITGNGLSGASDVSLVGGDRVWVTNSSGNSISIFTAQGAPSGTLTGNGLSSPYSLAVVGNQVWVVNFGNSTISRFNIDGTVGGSPISGNGLATPVGIVTINNQVWVDNSFDTISLFNFDGSSVGSPLIEGSLVQPFGMTTVGSEVLVTNRQTSTIARFLTNPPPPAQYTIAGFLWLDNNQNNRYESGEPLLSGVPVKIQQSPPISGPQSTVTDANGDFSFPNLYVGTYNITITAPPGDVSSVSNPYTVQLNSYYAIDFPFIPANIKFTPTPTPTPPFANYTPTPTKTPTPILPTSTPFPTPHP